MKKIILTFLSLTFISSFNAQTIEVLDNSTGAIIPSGSIVNVITTPSTNSTKKFKVKNNSTSTNTLTIIRTIITTNPGANFPFCFGCNCIGGALTTFSAICTFTSNEIAPNATLNSSGLWPEINEGATIGFSKVKYKMFLTATPADSTVIYLTYNGAVGLSEKNNTTFNLSVSPNPVNDLLLVKHSPIESKNSTIKIRNIVGSIVKETTIDANETATKIDVSQLTPGIYFVSVYANNSLLESKKIIISK